jgi:hypothetical protein
MQDKKIIATARKLVRQLANEGYDLTGVRDSNFSNIHIWIDNGQVEIQSVG